MPGFTGFHDNKLAIMAELKRNQREVSAIASLQWNPEVLFTGTPTSTTAVSLSLLGCARLVPVKENQLLRK